LAESVINQLFNLFFLISAEHDHQRGNLNRVFKLILIGFNLFEIKTGMEEVQAGGFEKRRPTDK
jgi:hypothetical protein